MSIVRRLARPLLATGYIAGGVNAFRNSSAAAKQLDPVLKALESAAPQVRPVTANRAQVAQGIAAAQVVAAVRGLAKVDAGGVERAAADVCGEGERRQDFPHADGAGGCRGPGE